MSDPRETENPLLPEEEDALESEQAEDVPAGGAGADSGAVESVRVDPDDEAEIPDRSAHNDEPGVGTRDGHDPDSGA